MFPGIASIAAETGMSISMYTPQRGDAGGSFLHTPIDTVVLFRSLPLGGTFDGWAGIFIQTFNFFWLHL